MTRTGQREETKQHARFSVRKFLWPLPSSRHLKTSNEGGLGQVGEYGVEDWQSCEKMGMRDSPVGLFPVATVLDGLVVAGGVMVDRLVSGDNRTIVVVMAAAFTG